MEEITMKGFAEGLSRTKTVVVPFGSVEEHGEHLPLGTDTIHVYELAKRACSFRPLFVAPPVWYGLCRSTGRHPGTLPVSGSLVRKLAVEIVASLHGQGLRNFIIISGHAGGTHMAALADAGEELLRRFDDANIAVLSVLDLISKVAHGLVETAGDSHAGEVETSLMLFLRTDQVDGTSPEEYPSFPKPILVRDKRRYWPGGVWGDPSKASLEKGKLLLDKEARALAVLADRLESFTEEGKK